MAQCGADIVVNYRTHPEEAEEVAKAVRHAGRKAITIAADVADRVAVEVMVQQGIDRFGKVDILVNNAGTSIRKLFLETSVAEVSWTIDVCMWGVFHPSQRVARHMAERGEGGKILIISSVHAFIPFGDSVGYNTAKAGVNNMGYTIATEPTRHCINVNVIEPGWTDTPGERNYFTDEELQEGGAALPWGRLGTIEYIGRRPCSSVQRQPIILPVLACA